MSDFKLSPINALHNKALASDKMVMLLTEGEVSPSDTEEISEAILAALDGSEFPASSIILGDSSAVVLSDGALSGDGNGNAVVHDGIFTGGKVLANDHLRFVGGGIAVSADLDAVNKFGAVVLGEIALPATIVQIGQKFRMSGEFNLFFADPYTTVPISFGLISSNEWAASEEMTNPTVVGGYTSGVSWINGERTLYCKAQFAFELAAGALPPQLTIVSSGEGLEFSTVRQISSTLSLDAQAASFPFMVPGATIDPGAEVLRIVMGFGDGSIAAFSDLYYNYDLKIDLV